MWQGREGVKEKEKRYRHLRALLLHFILLLLLLLLLFLLLLLLLFLLLLLLLSFSFFFSFFFFFFFFNLALLFFLFFRFAPAVAHIPPRGGEIQGRVLNRRFRKNLKRNKPKPPPTILFLFGLFIINRSNRENKVGTWLGSDIIDGVFAGTTTLEVNSAVSIEGSDV